MVTSIINWLPYGVVEYGVSVRVHPALVADPDRFNKCPRRIRHCHFTDVFMRLSALNNRVARKLAY